MQKTFYFIICFIAICFSTEARNVKGRVKCNGKGLASVIVTDGKSFTRTKGNGSFRFDIDENSEFVYIITPAGYSADWSEGSPAFYRKAEGRRLLFI